MKVRFLTLIAVLMLLSVETNAADIRTLFIDMPDSIMPLFTKSERMDFLDYLDSGMKARVTNRLGGESEMTLFRDDMLSIRTSESGNTDMLLLERKRGTVLICMITTVTGVYQDSRLSFYNEDWTPVSDEGLIDYPVLEDYLSKDALKNDSLPELQEQSLLRLQRITVVDGVLEFRYSSLDYIGEDADKYRSWFNPDPIRYVWTGKRFRNQKM